MLPQTSAIRSLFLLLLTLVLATPSRAQPATNCCLQLPGEPANEADAFIQVTWGNPVGTGLAPLRSLMTVDILTGNGSPIPPIPSGRYAGWCFDFDTPIDLDPPANFAGRLYSTCDPNVAFNAFLPNHPNVIHGPAKWKEINYLINHRTQPCNGLVPTMWEVQRAIYILMGQPSPTGSPWPNSRPAVMNCLTNSAINNAPAWQPKCGDKTAVIYNIDFNWDDFLPDVQLLIIEVPYCPPVACPVDVTIECDESLNPFENLNLGKPTTDECCSLRMGYNDVTTSGDCPGEYTVTRTWNVTNDCNQVTVCTQTIQVVDTQAPEVSIVPAGGNLGCNPLSIPTVEDISALVTATENCGIPQISITFEDAPQGCSVQRTFTVIATDSCGNASEPLFVVYSWTIDVIPPVLNGLPSASATYQCPGDVPVAPVVTAVDDCNGALNVTFNETPGGVICNTTITRTWSAVDACGNVVSFTQLITIRDETNPALSVPANVTVQCDAIPSVGIATALDNCDANPVVEYVGEVRIDGNCVGSYQLVRTWKATDTCGNVGTGSQIITVEDTTAPTFAGLPNSSASYQCLSDVPAAPVVIATDACEANLTVNLSEIMTGTDCGKTIVRLWSAVDSCGNSNSFTQTITVADTVPPVISCPPDITLACDESSDPAHLGSATATDNCSGTVTLTHSDVTGTVDGKIVITRTWTAADVCGNSFTCQQKITLPDGQGCLPAILTMTGSSSGNGSPNMRVFTTTNGVQVKVTAFSRTKDTGSWSPAFAGVFAGGLGVTDSSEDGGSNSHTVDNIGRDNFLLFEFSEPVIVTRAFMGYVVNDSDISVWIGNFPDVFNNHLNMNDSILSAFGYHEENHTTETGNRWAEFNSGKIAGNTLIVAALASDETPEDMFKLKHLDLCKPACIPEARIGNYVWHDVNENGIQENGENGVNGVKVDLFRCDNNTAVGTTTTSNNGFYEFVVAPGDYYVKFSNLPAGFIFSPSTAGTASDETDSDANPTTGMTDCTTLVNGETDHSWDAGIYSRPEICVATVVNFEGSSYTSGTKGNIRTFNASGVSVKASAFSRSTSGYWSPAYLGIYSGGLGVTDHSEGDGSGNAHTVDNKDRYNFILLEFSKPVEIREALLGYVVDDSDLTVWIGTFNNPYDNHLTLSDSLLAQFAHTESDDIDHGNARWAKLNDGKVVGNVIVIAASVNDSTPDDEFKIDKLDICVPTVTDPCTGSLAGFIAQDCDADGNLTGEAGLAGVVVKLKNSAGNLVDQTTTDSSGSYSFSNLVAATYTVWVEAPSGYIQTYDPDGTKDSKKAIQVSACENETGIKFGYTGRLPAVHLTISGPTSAQVGETITYTYTVKNTGNTCVYGGLEVRSALYGGLIWHKTPVAPGESYTFQKIYTVQSSDGPSLVNNSTAIGHPPGLAAVSHNASWNTQIQGSQSPAPSSLTAVPGNCKVVLSWSAIAGASSYKLKRSLNPDSGFTTIKTTTSTSFTDINVANGTAYYYVVVAIINGFESASSEVVSAIPFYLPSPWNTRDIGDVDWTGGASYSSSTFTIFGAGDDIWNTADAFRYVYQMASRDCTIVARVTSFQQTHDWAKAGVMIRESLSKSSRHASVFVTPQNGVAFQYRSSTGGASDNINTTGPVAPYWVAIKRVNDTFTAYRSSNGSTWISLGSKTIYMSDNVYIGLAVTSHDEDELSKARIDNVTIQD